MYLAMKQGTIFNEKTKLLFSSKGAHSLQLNDDASSIVSAIGQSVDYDNARRTVQKQFAADEEVFKPQFDAFLDFLTKEGFLTHSDARTPTNFRRLSGGGISRLFVELLSGCNLTCSHCYAHHEVNHHHLRDVDRLLDHMSEAVDLGVHKIDLTGGEALIFPGLRRILEHLTKLNVPVNLYSNLTLLDDKRINYLGHQSISSVITSIDALTPEVHDRFRGKPGAWHKTMENIQKLVDAGIPVRVNTVPTNETLHEVKPLCEHLYNEVGVTNIVIGTLFDVGRQVQSQIDHVAQKTISELVAKINVEVFGRDLRTWSRNNADFGVDISRPGCGVGRDMLFLTSWGEYAYCPILTSREAAQFGIGNFYEKSFNEVAEHFLKTTSGPSCLNVANCSFGSVCQSGCRARSFHSYGDLTARDKTRCDFWEALDEQTPVSVKP